FTVGAAGAFTITTTAGFPTATTITHSGALPSGVSFLGNGNGTATLSGTPAAGTAGTYVLTITASNGINPHPRPSFTLVVLDVPRPPPPPPPSTHTDLLAVGADAGGGPQVKVYNADGSVRFSFFAYDASFTGGVRVATGDVTGDGVDDIITGAGPSGGPHV